MMAQSKLWFNAGLWWGVLFDRPSEEYHIYRYDWASHPWNDTDTLKGEDGDDTVNSKDGVNGNDSLDGGAGADTKVTDATEKSIVGFP
jgi:hypothetical protein